MASFRAGEPGAGAKLIEIFYPELKRLAASRLRQERPDHSWQPTLLVNELYLEVSKIRSLPISETKYDDDKGAFFALAGLIMRRLLVHHARYAGYKAEKIPLNDLPLWEELRVAPEREMVEVELILNRLGEIDRDVRTVVELKVFEGCTADEIAHRMGCASVTVYRNWQFARPWLQAKLIPAPHGNAETL
jgi:RNA polymerase sigma factor (TIGR02999 family)